jgi:hypothetical protein
MNWLDNYLTYLTIQDKSQATIRAARADLGFFRDPQLNRKHVIGAAKSDLKYPKRT